MNKEFTFRKLKEEFSEKKTLLYKPEEYKNTKFVARQYHIVMVNFGEGIGSEKEGVRPALILSNNAINATSDNITVAPITSATNKMDDFGMLRLLSTQVYLSEKYYKALTAASVVQLEDMRTISKKRVVAPVTNLTSKSIMAINQAILNVFDLQNWY